MGRVEGIPNTSRKPPGTAEQPQMTPFTMFYVEFHHLVNFGGDSRKSKNFDFWTGSRLQDSGGQGGGPGREIVNVDSSTNFRNVMIFGPTFFLKVMWWYPMGLKLWGSMQKKISASIDAMPRSWAYVYRKLWLGPTFLYSNFELVI